MEKTKPTPEEAPTRPEDQMPGLSVDRADNEKVTPQEVRQETCQMNNNPRADAD